MADAGYNVTSHMVYNDVLTRAKGEEVAENICKSGIFPDAIFSASDFSALGALLVFKKHGLKIPEEIGIAGFANEPFTELTEPGITTLEQYSEEIGKSSARLLIQRIESEDEINVASSTSFKPKLILRGSTLKK